MTVDRGTTQLPPDFCQNNDPAALGPQARAVFQAHGSPVMGTCVGCGFIGRVNYGGYLRPHKPGKLVRKEATA